MTLENFIDAASMPPDLSPALQALWQAEKGDWEAAHTIAQDIHSSEGSWIHAHLHREEGDLHNARYWYQRAGRPESQLSLQEERHEIIKELL